jgi:hypothetical protein
MQNFVPANTSYIHYRTLEYVDPVPFQSQNIKVLAKRIQSQKNVPANTVFARSDAALN